MALRRTMLVVAGLLFSLSFLLPALGDASGFKCLGLCWNVLARIFKNDSLKPTLVGWFYYGGFVATNALFIALCATAIFASRFWRARFFASMIAALHVFSWLIINLVSTYQGRSFDIKAGYFLWLMSYLLLSSVCAAAMRMPHRIPDPAYPSLAPPAGPGGASPLAADH